MFNLQSCCSPAVLAGCDLEKSDFEAVFQDLYDEVFTGEDSVTVGGDDGSHGRMRPRQDWPGREHIAAVMPGFDKATLPEVGDQRVRR